mgnify:CR=1 FL=1|jgi:hypothetical protein
MNLYFKDNKVILASADAGVIVENDECVFVEEYDNAFEYILEDGVAIKGAEKPIEVVTDAMIADTVRRKTNSEARKYLASTDWLIVRFTETGAEIPAEVKIKRAEARNSVE